MSASSRSPAPPASSESEQSTGFKSFWKKSAKPSSQQSLTFVEQDPSRSKKSGRIRRIWNLGSSDPSTPKDNGDVKRRQQVYQAQKRHRNRKAEYIQSLEAEIARLQHLDAQVNSEKNSLAQQNKAIRDLLATQSIDVQLDSIDLASASAETGISPTGSATVDIRFDPDVNQERIFLDCDDSSMQWSPSQTTSAGNEHASPQERPQEEVGGPADSWAALDFILALEWPCKSHVHHYSINPDPNAGAPPDPEAMNGHALATSAAVLQSALPPPQQPPGLGQLQADSATIKPEKWQLPYSEIEKLIKLSENLELDEEILTPAQVYSAIRESVGGVKDLRPVLQALKHPLGSLMKCRGFGSVVETDMFWQQLEAALQELRVARPA